VRCVTRLAVDRAVERDQRVDRENRRFALRSSQARTFGRRYAFELAAGVLARDLDRIALGDLVRIGDDDLEGDAELLEDRPPLGRAAR
jgi:hypothetical protein